MGCLHSLSCLSNKREGSLSHTGTDIDEWPGVNKPYCYTSENNLMAVKDFQHVKIDHRLPLSKKNVFKLLRSWRGIKREMDYVGVEMFVRLFRADSKLQAMFHNFKDIRTDDELRSNEALEYHATLVMTTLDDAIVHIDNYEYVMQLLKKVAVTHVKFPGFRPEVFMAMKDPFLEAVRVTLGDRYTDNIRSVYTIAITFILATMVQGMSEALTSADPAWNEQNESTT